MDADKMLLILLSRANRICLLTSSKVPSQSKIKTVLTEGDDIAKQSSKEPQDKQTKLKGQIIVPYADDILDKITKR